MSTSNIAIRTKEWWDRLSKEERSRLWHLERAGNGRGSSYLPPDCIECPECSTPHSGFGLCPMCSKELNELLTKANGIPNNFNVPL